MSYISTWIANLRSEPLLCVRSSSISLETDDQTPLSRYIWKIETIWYEPLELK
jgi:hypothetical protein